MDHTKATPKPDHDSDHVFLKVPRSALTVVAPPAKYMRPCDSPAGRKAVLAAIDRGELTKYKPGKVVLVETAEHDAWIARHRVARPLASTTPTAAPSGDELDELLGLEPRKAGAR